MTALLLEQSFLLNDVSFYKFGCFICRSFAAYGNNEIDFQLIRVFLKERKHAFKFAERVPHKFNKTVNVNCLKIKILRCYPG